MTELLSNPEFWKNASIPVVAAVVGWFTNLVAIKMTFAPLEPFGRPPHGPCEGRAAEQRAGDRDTDATGL